MRCHDQGGRGDDGILMRLADSASFSPCDQPDTAWVRDVAAGTTLRQAGCLTACGRMILQTIVGSAGGGCGEPSGADSGFALLVSG